MSFTRSVVSDPCSISCAKASVRRKKTEATGQRMELQANRIVAEVIAGKLRPVDCVLTFLDSLLGCPVQIIEPRDLLSSPRQNGDDEAYVGESLVGGQLDIGDDTAGPMLGSGLVAEARTVAAHVLSCEQPEVASRFRFSTPLGNKDWDGCAAILSSCRRSRTWTIQESG